jgi:Cu(I)/Ag(I) efflux system membrane protein CusA/SilA
MLARIIELSARHKNFVFLGALFLLVGGWQAVRTIPLDAIPDLSDPQVIVFTDYPGQAPQVVEDQVTYPLTSALLAVPHVKTVRGFSFFGVSFVYLIFDEGTDLYWARSRTLEYLNYAARRLPAGITPSLGPDATGVGWVFQYALVDTTGRRSLADLRSLQDWLIRYELQSVPGVSEVASVGGFVKEYQVNLDPNRLAAFGVPIQKVAAAIAASNADTGGRLIEMAETEYMIRGFGLFASAADIERVVLAVDDDGTPTTVADVATVEIGPQARRGVAELDGRGETVGGVVVMRFGDNAAAVIERVKERLTAVKAGLPEGVALVTVYDRSALIHRAVAFLKEKLYEESVIVALVSVVFLLHLRSAAVAIVTLPLSILLAFVAMRAVGVDANIMSLGGIAIAIGALIDAAVVMIENAHKHLEKDAGRRPRAEVIVEAATEVGPALFFCLLIITLSFVPVFALEDQEGRLFSPLAFTKTFAMAGAALLSITLAPALMIVFIRGAIVPEHENPLNRFLLAVTRPAVSWGMARKGIVAAVAVGVVAATLIPATRLGSEFMPPLDEGDILYMPTTLPGISITAAKDLLRQTDAIIRTFPEVATVFGKVGRTDSATDPAPLSMFETVIQLLPRDRWRPGVTMEKLVAEMDAAIRIPGLTNAWTMPIKARLDMLATGIKTPLGIKLAGPDIGELSRVAAAIEKRLQKVAGARSVYAERGVGGKFLDIAIDREGAARYGLTVGDVNRVIQTAIGGMTVTHTVEGIERYPVAVRYQRELRDTPERLARTLIATPGGAQIPLSSVATISLAGGPMVIKTENTRPNVLIFIDLENVDIGTFVDRAKAALADVAVPSGITVTWSGQFEAIERAKAKLATVVPLTLAVILVLLYLNFGRLSESLLALLAAPLSTVGGIATLWLLDYHVSVAVVIGFIALAGVATEIGVLILMYIGHAVDERKARGAYNDTADVRAAVLAGVSERVRPIMMTVAAVVGGLLPIMAGDGTGADVMKRIAAPMVGGMVSVTLLALIVLPTAYAALLEWRLKRESLPG